MKYALTILPFGRYPTSKLSPEAYVRLKKAQGALSKGLANEERYDILVSSYLDFETEILSQAAHSMLRLPLDYEDFFTARSAFNRRLLNLFTAAELYLSALPAALAAIIGKDAATTQVKTLRRRECDANVEYWFMEALRNHAQHYGLPVHWVGHNHNTDGVGQERLLMHSVTLASAKDHLLTDKRFFKELLARMPEKVDLQNAAKIYIEGVSRIHAATRTLVEGALAGSRSLLEDAIGSYRKVFSEKTIGLRAVQFDGNEIVEDVPMLLNWDDIRVRLSRRNPELVNLRIRRVSGGSRADHE